MGTLSALLPAVLLVGSLGEARTVNLFDGSRQVFESHWREKKLRRPLTRYEVVEDGDQAVLMARSRKSASAVWRQLNLDPFQTGSITCVRFLEYDKQINRQPPSRTAARAGERNATR